MKSLWNILGQHDQRVDVLAVLNCFQPNSARVVAHYQRLEVFHLSESVGFYICHAFGKDERFYFVEPSEHEWFYAVVLFNRAVLSVAVELISFLDVGFVEVEIFEVTNGLVHVFYIDTAHKAKHADVATVNGTNDAQRLVLGIVALEGSVAFVGIGATEFFGQSARFFYDYRLDGRLALADGVDVVCHGSPFGLVGFCHAVGHVDDKFFVESGKEFGVVNVDGHGILEVELLESAASEGCRCNALYFPGNGKFVEQTAVLECVLADGTDAVGQYDGLQFRAAFEHTVVNLFQSARSEGAELVKRIDIPSFEQRFEFFWLGPCGINMVEVFVNQIRLETIAFFLQQVVDLGVYRCEEAGGELVDIFYPRYTLQEIRLFVNAELYAQAVATAEDALAQSNLVRTNGSGLVRAVGLLVDYIEVAEVLAVCKG